MTPFKNSLFRLVLLVCVLVSVALTIFTVNARVPVLMQYALGLPPNAVNEAGQLSCGQVTMGGTNCFVFTYIPPGLVPSQYATQSNGRIKHC
jgi:hypothetical protein